VDESQDNLTDDKSKDDILAGKFSTAKKRFQLAVEATKEMRDLGDEDIKFIAGDQWDEDIKQMRIQAKRPVITINRCPQMVRNVTNDQKLNRPSIKVYPCDDKADVETAKIFQGLIRQIENESNAEQAYDTGHENAAKRSYGYWRIVTEYESPTSLKQKILIKRIRNPNSVLLDPFHKEKDGSDANWGFVFEDIPKDEFNHEFPESEISSATDWKIDGQSDMLWIGEQTVRVAEYFTKEWKDDELIEVQLIVDGRSFVETILKSQAEEKFAEFAAKNIFVKPTGKTRKTKIPVIEWYKMDGSKFLEENIFPGQYIPIIPVYGEEHDIDGKVVRESVIRHSKDSQRMYNYLKSTAAETIALAPKSPWLVVDGQITPENAAMWRTANTANHPYLVWKQTDSEGNQAPPPSRQTYEPPIQAVTQAAMLESEDIKNTSGITDSAMGNRSNETSGLAINARAQQAQKNTFHLTDNVNLSIKHTGRILVDIIPIVYDAPQAIRILGENDEGEIVRINELFNYKGEKRTFDFSVGKYDVYVDSGPGFATKRQEAAAGMLEMAQSVPQLMQVAPDLIVRSLDWPNATELADRLKKIVDPKLIDNPDQAPIPPEIQAQLQQLQQANEMLVAQNSEISATLSTKKLEIESRERIEFAKMETQVALKDLEIKAKAADAAYMAELESTKAMIQSRLSNLDMNQPINTDFDDSGSDQVMDQQYKQEQEQFTGELPPGPPMELNP